MVNIPLLVVIARVVVFAMLALGLYRLHARNPDLAMTVVLVWVLFILYSIKGERD